MLGRFGYFARETLISLRRNLLMTLAGIITVAVSLSLLGAALVTSRLVDHGTERWKGGVEFEIFMNVEATQSEIEEVQAALDASKDVRSYKYLSKQDAYNEFKRLFPDQPDLVNSVDAAALPPSFRVAPITAEQTTEVAGRFQSQPGVDEVKTASKEVKRLLSITRIIRTVFIGVFILLVSAALFLIVNTIRLATFARRREIEVMKLVGASNWFVRIPFMLEGLVQGLIGAAFAVGAVYGLKVVFTDFIDRNSDFSRGFFVSSSDAFQVGLLVMLLGAAIGVIGSIVGLRRFIEA